MDKSSFTDSKSRGFQGSNAMKLLAIGINNEHNMTFSRDFEPSTELTDQEILESMSEANELGEPLDQVLLITAEVNDRGEIDLFVDELIQ